jgi:hypothetical protein
MSSARPLALVLLGLGFFLIAGVVARTGVAASGTTVGRSSAIMPGPAKSTRAADRLDRNDDCVGCHSDLAREWSHSLHRRSFEDPMFQAALARERDPDFCRSCHAPESDPRHEPTAREAAAGVACVSCHLDGKDGVVLAGPNPRADDSEVPHALRRTSAFASPDACAGCHEFWFPSGGRAGHDLKMQRTISEHARSRFADESCQSCHMPPARSDGAVHHDHGFAVVGQPQMLRAAVTIVATRPEPGRVVLELSPRLVGHAFPTGDLFRRLAVELHADDDGAAWSTQRVLEREFVGQRVGDGQVIKVEHADSRVGIGRGPRVVEFELPAELHGRRLRWVLVYERALEAASGSHRHADIWDRTPFADGRLPVRPSSTTAAASFGVGPGDQVGDP